MILKIEKIDTWLEEGQEVYMVTTNVKLNKHQFEQMIDNSKAFEFELKWW